MELVGLILIWTGYRYNVGAPRVRAPAASESLAV
jgi:hypothetical protein